ncbi:MAG: hypothetical protein KDB80_07260, partial [Planctomycetes bacterium]|nr:hypothetical protein [Planctomycetota bacterium]
MTRSPLAVPLCLWLLTLQGCGFGSAGIVAGASRGGGTNATPSLSDFDARALLTAAPNTSPAILRLMISDPSSNAALVRFAYRLPGESVERAMSLDINPVVLETSPQGTVHELEWDFTREAGLPSDGSFVDDVELIARVDSASASEVIQQRVTTGLGNDAPVVSIDQVVVESAGVVTMSLRIADTSDDLTSVAIEFSDDGGSTWNPARPTGILDASETPGNAFEGVRAPRAGTDLAFSWDSDHETQLQDLDRDVRLRVTPRDDVTEGDSVVTDVLRINNNDEPVVAIDQAALALNPDQRRGIPIRYTVADDEGDPVRVLFQWRSEGEPFIDIDPSLTPNEILELLDDDAWVASHRVCRPYPTFV